jgi:Fe-S-cluster containining protein
MQPFFERQPLRFSCTRCGQCCIAGDGYHVYLTGKEAESIRNYLRLSCGWFRRRYLQRLETGELTATSGPDGRCVFLQRDGRCRVYSVRPLQCRTYPFWPEVAGSAAAWRREARRCEGINQGAVVAPGRIRRAVRACLKREAQSADS